MQLRKPVLLLSSQCSFPTSAGPRNYSNTSSPSPSCRLSARARSRRSCDYSQCRRYATVDNLHDDAKPDPKVDGRHWPDSKGRHPTPYEILGLTRGATYSKIRFYELVKQYHPDRNSADTQAARELLLERYRLIITAHTILSDPQKRKAYDEFGLGWNEPQVGPTLYRYSTTHRWRSGTGANTAFEDDPMYNATWEDWERWYKRQYERERAYERGEAYNAPPFVSSFFTSRHRPRPVYLNNNLFLSIVFLFAALGGIGQATRAGEAAKSRTERLNQLNEQTNAALMQARQDSKVAAANEGRAHGIRRFVRNKEDHLSDDEFDGRLLRPGVDEGVCASGAVKSRDEPRFWQRPPEDR